MRLKTRILVFFLLSSIFVFSQRYTSKQFSTNNGLPDAYVYSSFQDNEGFLWSATTKGLVKFDGQVFQRYKTALDEGDFVYSGAVGFQQTLWFGTFSGRIFSYNKQTDSLSAFKGSINGSVDRIILSTDNKSIYFISKGSGIYVLTENKLSQLPFSQIYQVNNVVEIKQGILLLATPEGLFMVNVKEQQIKKVISEEADISQIQKTGPNGLLMSINGKGIVNGQLSQNFDSLVITRVDYLQDLIEVGISCFYKDDKTGLLYVATRDEKLHVTTPETKKLQTFGSAEYKATANSIFRDKAGNIWISTAGMGLFRFYKEEYGFENINNSPVYAITKNKAGSYFYGTNNGVWITDNAGRFVKHITETGGTTLGKITALYSDDEHLWVGTEGNGMYVINPATGLTHKLEFSEIKNITINSITGKPGNRETYVSTNLDGVYIYKDYKLLNHFSVQNSLLHNNVYYALGSKSNNVYYATHNTAINFSKANEVFEIKFKDKGLISDFNTFAEDAKGKLAIGTNGDGVYFLRDTVIIPMALNNKLESKFCNGLAYDSEGALWIMLRYSLYKYYPKQDVLKKVELGTDNSMLFNLNAFYADKNGEMLFGTNNSLVKFKSNSSEEAAPKCYILSVKLFDSLITKADKPVFRNNRYDVSFEYSALSLKKPEEVYFSYILEGRDNKWSELTRSRKADFFSLDEGTYTFKVKAYNSDGFESAETGTYTFTISPPFWKKAWFWIVLVILLGGLVYAIVKVRTIALEKSQLRLEKIVDEKTSELRLEKELVEAKNEIIEEQNKDIKSSITYAKRIQEALLPINNMDNDLRHKMLIYFKPKDIVSGDFYWFAKKENRFLIAACDCTGHGVPGAFMSMIGTTLLNKIVFDNNENETNKIISGLDRGVTSSLKQENSEVNDGMEAALCSINFETREIWFTGAKRPLFLFRKNDSGFELEEVKADKFAVGGFSELQNKVFNMNRINASAGDILYMFSDGIIDQFNAENNKRISTKRLRALLLENAGLPLEEQYKNVDTFIKDWQGDTKQTDDILLIGVRL